MCLDLTEAFDTVNHDFLFKIKTIAATLKELLGVVKIGTVFSVKVACGVPQRDGDAAALVVEGNKPKTFLIVEGIKPKTF